MSTVTVPRIGATAAVKACRSCQAPIYWGYTTRGKACPFNVIDGLPTEVSHFTTCEQAGSWSSKGKSSGVQPTSAPGASAEGTA